MGNTPVTACAGAPVTTITAPATPKGRDHPLELGLFTGEDWTYQGDAVDLGAFPADDWF